MNTSDVSHTQNQRTSAVASGEAWYPTEGFSEIVAALQSDTYSFISQQQRNEDAREGRYVMMDSRLSSLEGRMGTLEGSICEIMKRLKDLGIPDIDDLV